MNEVFTNILEGNQELDEMGYDEMMKEWMNAGEQGQGMDQMMAEWTK
jgi:hypothetical protein